jgi:hypothetical protein
MVIRNNTNNLHYKLPAGYKQFSTMTLPKHTPSLEGMGQIICKVRMETKQARSITSPVILSYIAISPR